LFLWTLQAQRKLPQKERDILLSSLAYQVLKDISFPINQTYQQLTEDLTKHFKLEQIAVAKRFHFNTAQQLSSQLILEFVAHLKN